MLMMRSLWSTGGSFLETWLIGKQKHSTMFTYRHFMNFDIMILKTDLNNIQWDQIHCLSSVNVQVFLINSFILELYNKHVPVKTKSLRSYVQPFYSFAWTFKILWYGSPFSTTVVIFMSIYLTDKSQNFSNRGLLSNSFHIKRGIPQGSILGQLLYSIYANHILNSKILEFKCMLIIFNFSLIAL